MTRTPIANPIIRRLTTNIGMLIELVMRPAPNMARRQPSCIECFRPKYSADHILKIQPNTPPIEYMQLMTPMIEFEYEDPSMRPIYVYHSGIPEVD